MTGIVIGETLEEDWNLSMLDVIQLVARQAGEEWAGDCCTITSSLDSCVHQTVTALWPSRIRTFIPLLAMREVRECIRVGHCPSALGES